MEDAILSGRLPKANLKTITLFITVWVIFIELVLVKLFFYVLGLNRLYRDTLKI